MMLAKVKEQRWNNACKCKSPKYPYISGLLRRRAIDKCGILFLYLLQPSITYQTVSSKTQIPLVIYNCQLLHRTASSKHSYLQLIYNCQLLHRTASSLNTDTYYYSYSQPSITSSDCVLQTQIHNRQLLHRTASSFKLLM